MLGHLGKVPHSREGMASRQQLGVDARQWAGTGEHRRVGKVELQPKGRELRDRVGEEPPRASEEGACLSEDIPRRLVNGPSPNRCCSNLKCGAPLRFTIEVSQLTHPPFPSSSPPCVASPSACDCSTCSRRSRHNQER